MTRIFADTSGFLALFSAADENHARAARVFEQLRKGQAPLLTTSYVVLETYSLLGRRFGLEAVKMFRDGFAPLVEVIWVDDALHNSGLDLLLKTRKRSLSLTDSVSFVVMNQNGLSEAFAFDHHFEQEGFSLLS